MDLIKSGYSVGYGAPFIPVTAAHEVKKAQPPR